MEATDRARAIIAVCFCGDMSVVPFVAVLAIGGAITGIFFAARRQATVSRQRLQALAEKTGMRAIERTTLGFTFVQALEGELGGREVRYWGYSTGSGKSRTQWVAIGVRPKQNGGLDFTLSRQGFGSKIAEWFGVKEIKVGDPQFDAAWFVQSNQPDFFAAALVPEIRARFMNNPSGSASGRYRLADGFVQYTQHGYLSDEKCMALVERELPLLQDLADIAEVFASSKA